MSENNEKIEYIQVRTPDKERLARLVNAAKGPDRTMAEFAAAIDVTASMLSRIVNGNFSKPIAIEVLQKIYDGRREGGNYTFEAFTRANGMEDKKSYERNSSRDRMGLRHREIMNRRTSMKNIITSELFVRGVAIQRLGLPNGPEKRPSKLFASNVVCDFAIRLPEGEEQDLQWGFFMIPQVRDVDEHDLKKRNADSRSVFRLIMQRFAIVFLEDAWEPERMKNVKVSFVFAERDYYQYFLESITEAKLHNRFSIILLDANAGKVLEEQNLQCSDFNCTDSFFDIEVTDSEEYQDNHLFQPEYKQLDFLYYDSGSDNE